MTPHLTPELVRAFRRGRISYDELVDLVFGHVAAVCTHCRAGCEALDQPPTPRAPALHLEAFTTLGQQYEPEILDSQERANRDLRLLKKLPPAMRRQRVERARRRFRGEDLVALLFCETERCLHTDPCEAFHWAELAWVAAWSTPQLSPDTLALAGAQMGNARRAAGALQEADKFFDHVRYLVERHAVTDLGVLAHIQHLEGSLHKDQRRLGKAKKALQTSALLFRLREDSRGLARSLMSLGDAYFYGGEIDQALSAIGQVLEILPFEVEPRDHLWARHNLACYLAEAGRFEEAALIRETDAPLSQEIFSGISQFRLFWLDGRISAGRGDVLGAIHHLSQAREGFLGAGIPRGAMLVATDLASLYAREGRSREFRDIAREFATAAS